VSTHLSLANIRDCWDEVLPGLLAVKAKTEAPWRPEDIYAACVSGQAHLYRADPGFVIVQADKDRLTGEAQLLIWVAYAEGQGNIEAFQDEMDDLAREHEFGKLVMWSKRPGWAKVPGWTLAAQVYERRLG
jgi:hypothetical protein